VERASEEIQTLILGEKMPKDISAEIHSRFKILDSKYVAVRSSATAEDSSTAAWAGQLESYLNTTKDDLLPKVQKCWASLFTPRAIFYRFEKDLHKQKISVAVVVQKMVESEVSGIAFSVHPVTEDRNQLIIEAGLGLGEAIVSGQITPDSYVVEKTPRRIIDKNVSEQERGLYRASLYPSKVKQGVAGNEWRNISTEHGAAQKLSDGQILELAELVLKIENHYDFPCDIEWALEKGKFYIAQSRPITTLLQEPIAMSSRKIHMSKLLKILQCGEWIKESTRKSTIHRYFDFSEAARNEAPKVLGVGSSSAVIISENDEVSQYRLKDDRGKYIAGLFDLFNGGNFSYAESHFLTDSESYISWLKKRLKESSLPDASNEALANLVSERHRKHQRLVLWQWFGFAGKYALEKVIEKVLVEYALPSSDAQIIFSLDRPVFLVQENRELQRLALMSQKRKIDAKRVNLLLVRHLSRYRHAIMYDETYEPMTMDFLRNRFDTYKRDSHLCHHIERSSETFAEAKKSFQRLLIEDKFSEKHRRLIKFAHMYTEFSELRNHYRGLSALLSRPLFELVARRLSLTLPNLLAFTDYEIAKALNGKLLINNKLGELRRKYSFSLYHRGIFEVLTGTDAKDLKHFINVKWDGDQIQGVVAFRGPTCTGRVKVINSSLNIGKLKSGEILVSSMTRPEFITAIKKAKAIVTDEGGIMCHAAIIARELKKPCIIGTKIATKVLKDGDVVEVDADRGIVKILKRSRQGSARSTLPK